MVSAIRSTVLFIIVLMSIVAPSYAHATSKIMIFGDSLTAGYRLKASEALPEVLEKKLLAHELDVEVINGGVSGDTTTGGMSRLAWMLDKHSPDVVMVALGGNDMMRGIAPNVVRQNLKWMLKLLASRDIKTILMAVKMPPNQDATYSAQFNAIYPELAEEHNVALYPFFLEGIYGHPDYMLKDGIHPNAKGVDYIAAYLAEYFLKTGWI